MKLNSEKVKIKDTTIMEGTSGKTGKPYRLYMIYVEENGITTKILADQRLKEKAEKLIEKIVTLQYYIDPNGRITLNEINM